MKKLSHLLTSGLFLSTLCALAACEPKTGDAPASDAANEAEKDDGEDSDDDDESNPFSAMAQNPFAAMLGKKLGEPGPYDPPKQSEGFDADAPHLRVLALSGAVQEVESFDPFAFGSSGGKQTRALLDELDELGEEEQLEGLVLRVGSTSMDMARAAELRAALLEFKAGGERSVHCHAEVLDNHSYYLTSACDDLTMAPVGTLVLPGPAATPVHLKGLLDKLGVKADFLHVGAFKGAAEPLTREAPSPEMIETLQAIIDHGYETMVSGIAEGRKKPRETVEGWIDTALFTSEQAAEAGLIDTVEPWEAYLERVRGEGDQAMGWAKVESKQDMFADPMALQRFIGLAPPKRPSEPHVALIYAVGNIIDGKGQGAVGARQEIASAQLVPVLDRVAADDKVQAVVLRVDSGGGSALASEQIWHAVERLKTKKPIVVSMAGVAASGGYYISCGANEIYADADTLTGSIGVVGGKIVLGEALSRLGIETYAVTKGERALMWSAMDPWTAGERELVQGMMEQTYEVFLSRVAAGRGMERDAVHEIAQGRVWTGADAKARGLVDEIGGLDQALAAARELGSVGAEVELEVYPGEPTLKDLLGSFDQAAAVQASVGLGADGLPPGLSLVLDELALGLGPAQAQLVETVRGSLHTLMQLRGTTLWAVEWAQPV
ncbi:signal peptide peptidase SppA [Pseudenhygromyxa sp. WMMC2535]|uniref:signal peptide peptidase SppA n=1 Tax=Pseudenhygromyxa sp. WMMC2535 TaxID=2712867 RepID=UPI0015558B40|nr:signal peptide peptidase SppA [Pseudenhygromyxa sp. WMMC2535]NVB39507.1 signal peptide peptidase SppA [Pseudenhygromyxa sp. WMMC2535]